MLIGLFRDSVMRCFCHTCSVNSAIAGRHMYKKPLSKKINKKPRCKQPKKTRRNHATEIRAEEKSRGGMSYEVILSQAVAERPPSPSSTSAPSSPRALTQEDIDHKLEQAEQRRKTLEAERVASISERLCRLEEAARKRQEVNEEFVLSAASALEQKLDASAANREAHLDGLRARVADHLSSVEGVRRSVEEQTDKLRTDILAKMTVAQDNRDDHLRSIMAKLQAHEAGVMRVRESHEQAMLQLDERIRSKQDLANENREAELEKKLDALRQHLSKVEDFKEQQNRRSSENTEKLRSEIKEYEERIDKLRHLRRERCVVPVTKLERVLENREKELENRAKEVEEKMKTKLDLAEKNRAELAEKAKKAREEQERRAEAVRANKQRLASPDGDTNSSG